MNECPSATSKQWDDDLHMDIDIPSDCKVYSDKEDRS